MLNTHVDEETYSVLTWVQLNGLHYCIGVDYVD